MHQTTRCHTQEDGNVLGGYEYGINASDSGWLPESVRWEHENDFAVYTKARKFGVAELLFATQKGSAH